MRQKEKHPTSYEPTFDQRGGVGRVHSIVTAASGVFSPSPSDSLTQSAKDEEKRI